MTFTGCFRLTVTAIFIAVVGVSYADSITFEDAEDGTTDGWVIYDNDPAGASITNSIDTDIDSHVITLSGSGADNGFRLGNTSATTGLNIQGKNFVSWRLKSDEPVYFFIATTTTNGLRYLSYKAVNNNAGLIANLFVQTGLGTSVTDGQWHTINRNLQDDLTAAEPSNEILSINGFLVRGSMSLDDIAFHDTAPISINSPPSVQAGSDVYVDSGLSITLTGSASDSDGTISSYQWTDSSGQILANTASFSFTSTNIGDNTLTLTAFDNDGDSNSDSIVVTVNTVSLPSTIPNLVNYQLVFADEFNDSAGSSLNPEKWDTGLIWGPYLPINNEEQLYVDTLGMHSEFEHTPFELTGSTLKITATSTDDNLQPPVRPLEGSAVWQPRSYSEYRYNGPTADGPGYEASNVNYLSGVITTYESLKMTHGYVEMRAKLPAGRGLWPAFWLLTTHYVEDVPEIDVVEFLGQDVDRLYHTYHYFDVEDDWRKISTPSYATYATDWTQEFHTFGMAWSPTEIIYYVDGVETQRITDEDYLITGQAMYLIANLAVGGNWPGAPDATTIFPATYEIDYIRAYERKLEATINLADDYQLMFEDEFTGSSLDASKWNTSFLWGPYLTINSEEQYYVDTLGSDAGSTTPSNTPFVLDNGVLSITARESDDINSFPIPASIPGSTEQIWQDNPTYQQNNDYSPGSYTSGIMTTYESFKFVNGYVEMRAKIPSGQGLWPAFWLLNGYYVGQQPEIDILEVLGHNPHQSFHTFHRLENGVSQSDQGSTDNGNPGVGYSDDFHTYGVRWQRGKIDWYIDGQIVYTYEDSDVPYQLMYVIVNLAVGGAWPGSPDSTTVFPSSLDIDYIRVYQEKHKEEE